MLTDALIAEFSVHAQDCERREQPLGKIGIGGHHTWRDAIALAGDDAVGKFVTVIDRSAPCWAPD